MTWTALHIGDLHFWRFPRNPLCLLGKRLLGVANLGLRRARKFHQHRAGELVAHARGLEPDHVLFSGDFTTTALDHEFQVAATALERLLPVGIAVPGNHDRYNLESIRRRTFERHFGSLCQDGHWPHFHLPGEGVGIACLDPTTSNGLDCYGRVDPGQAQRLSAWLKEYSSQLDELWLLCHFPAEDPPDMPVHSRGEQLRDSSLLLDVLGSCGLTVLFLHGHHHHRWIFRSYRTPNITYLNAGAPMMSRGGKPADLGFYQLTRDAGGTHIDLHSRQAGPGQTSGVWVSRPVVLPAAGVMEDLQGIS